MVFNVELVRVTLNASLAQDFGVKEYELLSLAVELEQKLGITISPSEMEQFTSMSQMVKIVKTLIPPQSALQCLNDVFQDLQRGSIILPVCNGKGKKGDLVPLGQSGKKEFQVIRLREGGQQNHVIVCQPLPNGQPATDFIQYSLGGGTLVKC